MLSTSEIWGELSPTLNHDILEWMYVNDKKSYRRVVDDMAMNLRKRPKALLEMPRVERHTAFQPLLGLPHFETLTQHLLTTWLTDGESEMLVSFLDDTGIEHDGNGKLEMFPETLDRKKAEKGVSHLYEKYDEEKVGVYLKMLEYMTSEEWPKMTEFIRKKAGAQEG